VKLLILELDDCLIYPKNKKHTLVSGVSDIEVPDIAYEKLKYYSDLGFTIAVITGQPHVAFGVRTIDDVYSLLYATNHILNGIISAFVICPHEHNGSVKKYATTCDCKKPKLGMFKTLLKGLVIEDTEVEDIIVVGNKQQDKDFAKKVAAEYYDTDSFF
jgi:D-glycero-D-manno-heptose 1,7-bisphosphate phosphatase